MPTGRQFSSSHGLHDPALPRSSDSLGLRSLGLSGSPHMTPSPILAHLLWIISSFLPFLQNGEPHSGTHYSTCGHTSPESRWTTTPLVWVATLLPVQPNRHVPIFLFITTTGCYGIPRNAQPLFFQVALPPVKSEPALRRTYWLSEIASQERGYPGGHPRNTTRGYKARQTVSDEERLTRGGLLVREGMSMIKGKNLGGAKERKRKHKVKARI